MAVLWPKWPNWTSYDHYVIDGLEVSKTPVTMQTTYLLRFHTIDNPTIKLGFTMMFSDELLAQMSEKEIIGYLADAASKDVEHPVAFIAAIKHWYFSNAKHTEWTPIGYIIDKYSSGGDYWQYDNGGLLPPSMKPPPFPGDLSKPAPSSSPSGVDKLPGINEIVNHPRAIEGDVSENCSMYSDGARIKDLIIHLNDSHKWTREQIADWLDTLCVDLRFKSEDDKLSEQHTTNV